MLVALAGLVFGVAVMDNVLPLGTTGSLLSGGTVPVLSVAVGVEVTAGGDADPRPSSSTRCCCAAAAAD